MNLKFYTSVAKGLKLKFWKFYGPVSTFLEVTGEKLVQGGGGEAFSPPSPKSWIELKCHNSFQIKNKIKHKNEHTVLLPDVWFLSCNKKF